MSGFIEYGDDGLPVDWVGPIEAESRKCPYCGLSGCVSSSKRQPGTWWCDGCAEHFPRSEK